MKILGILLSVIMLTASVTMADDNMSIGELFHHETGFDDNGAVGKNLKWGEQMPLYKKYENAEVIKLPAPSYSGMTVEKAIKSRKSIRRFTDKAIDINQLSEILYAAGGITHKREYSDYEFRAAPSGGALYPIELYVIAHDIENLESGLYHYQVSDHSLELIKKGEFNNDIHKASFEQGSVGFSPATIIMTARFARSTRKYGDRGYRYTYMESGAICQNIYLEAASLGLGTVVAGAFNDAAVNSLLEIDGKDEAVLLIMPVGYSAE